LNGTGSDKANRTWEVNYFLVGNNLDMRIFGALDVLLLKWQQASPLIQNMIIP